MLSSPSGRIIAASLATAKTVTSFRKRLASYVFRLRYANENGFGRFAYAMFLIHGVVGMPEVPEKVQAALSNMGSGPVRDTTLRNVVRLLPTSYGKDFGKLAYGVARKMMKTEEDAEDLLGIVSAEMLSNRAMWNQTEGKTLSQARSYVLKLVQMRGLNLLKSKKIRNMDTLDGDSNNEEAVALIDKVFDQGASGAQLSSVINDSDMEEIEHTLEREFRRIDPGFANDIGLYLQLLVDGHSDRQILINQMLPSLKVKPIQEANWSKRYRPVIKDVLEDVLLGS